MKKALTIALVSLLATAPAFAQAAAGSAPVATRGKMLIDASGARLAPVYRVGTDGSAQIVFEGRMVTVPGSTLSVNNGKLVTSLKKTEVIALR